MDKKFYKAPAVEESAILSGELLESSLTSIETPDLIEENLEWL